GTDAPFRIDVQPYQIDSMPALHSGVFCESDGKWLLIGGRTNGLHGFQGLILFPEYTQNTTIYVVDPSARKLWTATTDAVPAQIREHINSSNMQWVATSNGMLHIIGGYGYSNVRDSFITFPYRTSVRIDELINAVTNKTSLNGLFKQEYDIRYAVCGAHACEAQTPNHMRLIFGHRFDGIYNREDNGSGFTQQYTNSVALIAIDSTSGRLSSWQSVSDTLNYHRRDYALGHSFSFRDKQRYVTAYSGVFTPKKNTAYTTCVDIRNDSIVHNSTINQLYSHYHCATATFLDTLANRNHTLFFGGMALNHPDSTSGIPVLDTAIPFVRTISCITRFNDGTFRENVVGTLPSLEGTNAYFFPAKSPYPDMPVMQQNSRQFIGYMYGGIISPKPNISQEDPAIST
ncbi:MAG: hypothetical protein JNL32_16485, partial [Candidatus Kapabacteria bacterium]|nr:hypothetical protein [Candidatus Kapabacteria bacterium]